MTVDPNALRLVVNADDFGFSPTIDRGILHAHRCGIVTSTSIIGTCADPGAVKAALAEAPRLGVGVHLTLSGAAPLAPRTTIRSLLNTHGTLPPHARDVFVAWARGDLRGDDIVREFDAQVGRLRDLGLVIDHLNTHRHIGFLPVVADAVQTVARRHNIPGIRSSAERPTLAWITDAKRGVVAAALSSLSWFSRRRLGALRHGPQTWGYMESGQLDEIRILEIFGRLGPGPHELICHPGEGDDDESSGQDAQFRYLRARERDALCSPTILHAIDHRKIQLCRWADLF